MQNNSQTTLSEQNGCVIPCSLTPTKFFCSICQTECITSKNPKACNNESSEKPCFDQSSPLRKEKYINKQKEDSDFNKQTSLDNDDYIGLNHLSDACENESEPEMFKIQSCHHTFCCECLSKYCVSKVMDGIVNIKCCEDIRNHDEYEISSIQSTMLELLVASGGVVDHSTDNNNSNSGIGGADICNSSFQKEEILYLLRRFDNNSNSEPAKCLDVKSGDINEKSGKNMTMVDRYERFKFDSDNKNTARRCPKCDHPHIFKMFEKGINVPPDYCVIIDEGKVVSTSSEVTSFNTKKNCHVEGENDVELGMTNSSSLHPHENTSINAQVILGDSSNDSLRVESNIRDSSADQIRVSTNVDQKKAISWPKVSIVKCKQCETEFCYFHSNAHVGLTCEEYETKIHEEELKNSVYLKETNSKKCPKCGVFIQKDGGCNHMKCLHCGESFCWLCMETVDDVTFPAHFQWWNLDGCPNVGGGADGNQNNASIIPLPLALFCSRFFILIQVITIGIPAVVLAIISSILCYSCIWAWGDNNRDRAVNLISFWGNVLIGLVFLILTLVLFVSGFLIFPPLIFLIFIGALIFQCLLRIYRRSNNGDENVNNS